MLHISAWVSPFPMFSLALRALFTSNLAFDPLEGARAAVSRIYGFLERPTIKPGPDPGSSLTLRAAALPNRGDFRVGGGVEETWACGPPGMSHR